jgi:hypothetical protein
VQLARQELSQWRHAKEEELSALKVLTEDPLDALRRVRKKTHKGEQDVERDTTTLAALLGEGAPQHKREQPEGDAAEARAEEHRGGGAGEQVTSIGGLLLR